MSGDAVPRRFDADTIQLMEWVSAWKKRAEIAEAKVEDLLTRQDQMATQIESLQSDLLDSRLECGRSRGERR